MFSKKGLENTNRNKVLNEASYLDGLCELAIERHFNLFLKSSSNSQLTSESVDSITTNICTALVKDLEFEIWQRIAPRMLTRVEDMKRFALDATGENKISRD